MILYFTYELTSGYLEGFGGSGWISDNDFVLDYEGDLIFGSAWDFEISDSSLQGTPFMILDDFLIFQNRVIFRSGNRGSMGFINYYPLANDDFFKIRDRCPELSTDCTEILVRKPLLLEEVNSPTVSVFEPSSFSFLMIFLLCLLRFLRRSPSF